MDTAIILAHNAECAKSTVAYEKVVKLASLMEEDRAKVGESFYYDEPEVGDARLLGILDAMIWVVGRHVPKLTLQQWTTLLSQICNVGVINPKSLRLMPWGLDDIVAPEEDLEVYRSLQPIEWFGLSLVSNRMCTANEGIAFNLREVIAEFTGEPVECVFADDPSVADA